MKMKYSGVPLFKLLTLTLMAVVSGLWAGVASGSGLTLSAGSTSALPGSQVVVPIKATGFNNVAALQFSTHWSPAVVSLVGIEQYGLPGMGAGNFGFSMTNNGTLTVSWDDLGGLGQTVPDGTAIFTLRFQFIGVLGDVSPFLINDTPTPVEAADGDLQLMSVTLNAGQIAITAPNAAPSLAAIPNRTVNEGSLLSFTAVASDPDGASQTLTFSLDPGAPAGAAINPSTGAFTWLPAESQGPGAYPITVRVTDNGFRNLNVSQTFTVTVNEVNSAPIIAVIGNKTINEGSAYTLAVAATDTDIPGQTLTYSLAVGAPAGASVDPITGLFTWTPTEAQGPATYSVTIRVTDNGIPALSSVQTFLITVNEVNSAPTLAPISNKTVNEGSLLTFAVSGTDPDLPAQTLTYSLDPGAPAGASINSATGVFSWTPGEAQGPSTNTVTIRVTDNASAALSASQTISITVNEVNLAPVITAIGTKTVNEGNLLTFTVAASDPNLPVQTLTYSLDPGAPTGASIGSGSGVFTWSPTEAQGPSTNRITIRVTDNGSPPLSSAQVATIIVNEVNTAPTLTAIANKTVDEGVSLTFTASASDADLPPQNLTFSLDPGAPAGATIHPLTGVFTWTPTEAQGPNTYSITVRVTDDGPPALSFARTFSVTVNEVNTPPVLASIGNKNIAEGALSSFRVTATDADIPVQTLTFSLVTAPTGASIDPATGVFTWTPSEAQASSTNPVTIRVTDNGSPPASASQTITVTVGGPNSAPVLAAIGNKTVTEGTLLAFTVSATDADVPPQTLSYSLDAGAPSGAAINPASGLFTWTPTGAQGPSTNLVTIRVTDDGSPASSAAQSVTIIVYEINTAPILAPLSNRTINEGTLLSFSASATDSDLPAQALTYSLDAGAPSGASIDPVSGLFTWTPSEAQGPSVVTLTVRATDSGFPAMSAFQSVTITVKEVNSAPVLSAIENKVIDEGNLLTFSAAATDPDIPAQTLTYSLDTGAPLGASINPVTGVFTWTPTEGQGPSTNSITIRVTDNGSPALSAFQAFIVVVNDVNNAPILAGIGNKTVPEGTLLTFRATATDSDVPAQTLTFSLDAGAPVGANINPSTGVFTWTPTEAQGPSTNLVTVRVTDNGSPPSSGSETITITVNEVNTAPVLATIGNKTNNELSLLTFTVSATDSDLPAQAITYSLDPGAPAGAAINPTTGVFTWTPTEAQGPSTFLLTIRATDNGSPALSAVQTISVLVKEVNSAPVLAPIGNKTVNEGSLLSFTAAATDGDLPAQTLSYRLDPGAPAGAVINAASGVFSWTPTEAQGPGSYPVTVRVTDNGSPAASAAETITITVNEVNSPPVLIPIAAQTASPGNLLTFTALGTDSDLPAQTLTYTLDPGAPAGAAIDPSSGLFTWTPASADVATIIVRVTDDGSPPLSAFQNVAISFADYKPTPVLAAIGNKAVKKGSLLTFTVSAVNANLFSEPLTYSIDAGAPAGASLDPVSGVFVWAPPQTQGPATNRFTFRASDHGLPPSTSTETILIYVTDSNAPPALALIGSKTVTEGTLLSFNASPNVTNLATGNITYSLDPGSPAGATIDPVTGVFTWIPTEVQAPSTVTVTVRASDSNSPPQSVFQNVVITVREANSPPLLGPIGDKTIDEGSLLSFTVSASDPDYPAQILTYSLGAGAPVGASIQPTTGLFTWTPTETQGPNTNHILIRVTDNGSPPLSASQTILVTVNEVNTSPLLAAIADHTVNEGAQLSFRVTASDSDSPPQNLRYGLGVGAPSGASIDSVTGVFSWTPSEMQGPLVYPITIWVTDDGTPALTASQTITLTVNEVNSAPVLAPIGNKTISEGSLLSFPVSASDSDVPVQTLTYNLGAGAPMGASIDPATGVFTWTPTEIQGPRTYPVMIRVTDNGSPALSAFQSIAITVTEANTAPVLAPIGNRTINEGALLTFKVTAVDADVPAQALTYSLEAGAPTGANIQPATGVFTWTPSELQGPSTNLVTVRVTDSGSPAASTSQTIAIIVNEQNSAPVLAAIPAKAVNEGSLLTFKAAGTDPDVPGQTLTYSLDPGAPTGASIDPTTGIFSWTPSELQGPSTITLTVRVTDSGSPPLSAFQNVSITVKEVNLPPVIAAIDDQTIDEGTLLSFGVSATDPDVPAQTLTFSLVAGSPRGTQINHLTGLFSWTPTEAQGPSTNRVGIRVTDNGVPPLSATQMITITVREVNSAPTLAAIPDKTINEGALLTFKASATDPDLPAQVLAYSLDPGGPAGASIHPVTGIFTWTPAEEQGPNIYSLTIRATDSGSPGLSASRTVLVTVNEVNSPPFLAPIGNQSVNEGSLLTFTVSAHDADVPAQNLTYSLAGAPTGASIDPVSGVFTWTPTETQGPRTYPVTVRVTDDGTPALTAVQTITITVTEVVSPPVLAPIGNKTVDEGTLLTFKAVATDADLPIQVLTFSLGSNAPPGATIHPASGVFTWTPTEAQGPSTNSVTILVTDSGSPRSSASETITIVVNEVNRAPVLAPIAPKTCNEQAAFTFTVSATDPDIPSQTLTYSLDPGAPDGASIDPSTGIFTWTPTEVQGPTTVTLTVRVTDNGSPPMSAFQNVTITVKEANTPPTLAPINDITVSKGGLVTFSASATDADEPPQTLTYTLGAGAPIGARIDPSTGLFIWLVSSSQKPGTNAMAIRVSDNGVPSMASTQHFTITVVESSPSLTEQAQTVIGAGPLLEAFPSTNSQPVLILHGLPGTSYAVESTSDEGVAKTWQTVWEGVLTNSAQVVQPSAALTNRLTLFRAVQK